MKQVYTFMLTLLFASVMMAKGYRQEGIAYLYDYKTKTKRPIANVSLTVADAKPTVSGADGTFVLEFENRGLGDKIAHSKQPYYQGLKIFNKKEFENWFIVKDRIRLIMCNKDEFDEVKERYYELGKQSVIKKYDQKIAALKKEAADYQQQLQELQEEKERILDDLKNSADAMARLDQSELDDQMREVFRLYENGDVDEAMQKLTDMKLEEKFLQTIERKQYHEQEAEAAKQDSALVLTKLRSSIDLYKNNGDWEKVGNCLKLLADKLNTYEDVFEYAYFCKEQRIYHEAEIHYKRAFDILENENGTITNNILYKNRKGYLYIGLTCIYHDLKSEEEHKNMCIKACEFYSNLNNENFLAYGSGYAGALRNMGVYYDDKGQYDDAISINNESLKLYMKLEKIFPGSYIVDIAGLQNNIGLSYSKKGNNIEAERLITEAIISYRKLSQINHKKYAAYLSYPLTDIGLIYIDLGKYKEAEEALWEALEIRFEWTMNNPYHAEPLFSKTLNFLDLLYEKTQRFSESKNLYEKVLILYRKLAKDNPKAYEPDVARTLYNLSILYYKTQHFSESESMYKEALDIYKKLAKDNPQVLASTLCGISFTAIFLKKYTEAEQYAREGLEIDSTQHLIATNLAAALLFQGRYAEAEKIYLQYKDELKESFLDDFKQFEEAGVIPKEYEADVEKIKKLLNE